MLNVNLNGLTFSKEDFDVTASLRDLLATGRQVSLEAFRGSRRIDNLVGNFFSVASLEEDKSDDKKEGGVKEEKKEEKEGEKKSIIKHIRDFIVKMYEKIKAFFGKVFGWFKRESAKADKNIEDIENLNANAGKPEDVKDATSGGGSEPKDGASTPKKGKVAKDKSDETSKVVEASGKPKELEVLSSENDVGEIVDVSGTTARPKNVKESLRVKGKWINDSEDPKLFIRFPKTGIVALTIGGLGNESVGQALSDDKVETTIASDYTDGRSARVFKAVSSMVYTLEVLTKHTNEMAGKKTDSSNQSDLTTMVATVNSAVTGTPTPGDKGKRVDIFGRAFNFAAKVDGGKALSIVNTGVKDTASLSGDTLLYVPNLKEVRAMAGLHKDLAVYMSDRKITQLVSKISDEGDPTHLRNLAKLYSTATGMTTMYNSSLIKMMATLGKMTNGFIKAFKIKFPLISAPKTAE